MYKIKQMTHITSGLLNRKYKAVVVAPVAANAMRPIRGISCNAHVFKDVVINAFYIQLILFYKKWNKRKTNKQKNLTSFFFLSIWKNPDISNIQNIKLLEKNKNYISNQRTWNSARGWRQRVRDAAACGRSHLLRAQSPSNVWPQHPVRTSYVKWMREQTRYKARRQRSLPALKFSGGSQFRIHITEDQYQRHTTPPCGEI